MNAHVPFLWISPAAIVADPALSRSNPGARGARKVVVNKLFRTECEATDPVWFARDDELVPVLVQPGLEIAIFTEKTVQDHHHHKVATEIYEVMTGTMRMRIDGQVHTFEEGSTIVILPGTWHEVLRDTVFTAKVFAHNCPGPKDKYTK